MSDGLLIVAGRANAVPSRAEVVPFKRRLRANLLTTNAPLYHQHAHPDIDPAAVLGVAHRWLLWSGIPRQTSL